MRNLVLILFSVVSGLYAQEPKSLLWEVSGNGLEKPSYVYGTMHVSRKIAFRLDDVFYTALQTSEAVALESDPATWLDFQDEDYFDLMGMRAADHQGFYIYPFVMENPKKENLAQVLSFEDQLLNGLLYRTSPFSQDFEEETYLDMFLYQAGKKLGKDVVALEDLEESRALVGRAALNAMRDKPAEWLQKRLQQQSLPNLMQEAYRNRDLALLDSLDQGMYSNYYLEHMLYARNTNMLERLVPLMHTQSVFTGVGAAHLPGEKGILELLRQQGYTVKPLVSRRTTQGAMAKDALEKAHIPPVLTKRRPDDGFFSLKLPNKLYPINEGLGTTYVSPDLANGSYMLIHRMPTHHFIKKESVLSLADIDALLFENIPGTILEKTKIEKDGYPGIDIKNRLKNGKHQRYQLFLTPLEVLVFKMGADGGYVSQASDTVFNSLRFRPETDLPAKVHSPYKDYHFQIPGNYRFTNQLRKGTRQMEAYDTDSYYFMQKASLADMGYLESDTFELKQIQKRFTSDLGLKPKWGKASVKRLRSTSDWPHDPSKKLHLETRILGPEYYLIGCVTPSQEKADAYFDSFRINLPEEPHPYKVIKDTSMLFSTNTTVPAKVFVMDANPAKNKKSYLPFQKKATYTNANNEAVQVKVIKSHDLYGLPSLDSVWARRKAKYRKSGFILGPDSVRVDTTAGLAYFDVKLRDTATQRTLWVRNSLRAGLLHELRAVLDQEAGPSAFVRNFFEHFKPLDTLVGSPVLGDKVPLFFYALRAKDSLALTGYKSVYFDERHIDSLTHYISNYDWATAQRPIQSDLIHKLIQINDPRVRPFLWQLYSQAYGNSDAQIQILQALTKKADEKSVVDLLTLLETDLPLPNSEQEVASIFAPFFEKPELASALFPDLLGYSGVPEYKAPVISLLATYYRGEVLKPKVYKRYKNAFLNDAQLLLKRVLAAEKSELAHFSHFKKERDRLASLLSDYLVLLQPFSSDKKVQRFMEKVPRSQTPRVRVQYVLNQAILNGDNKPALVNELAKDPESRVLLYEGLQKAGKLSWFPNTYAKRAELVASTLIRNQDNPEIKLEFVKKQSLNRKGVAYVAYFFKEIGKKGRIKMHVLAYTAKDKLSEPSYNNGGFELENTESETDGLRLVLEEFELAERKRAMVYRPNAYYFGVW